MPKKRPAKAQVASSNLRDRIKELRRVPASELLSNPKNWRRHPDNQRAALNAVIKEVGVADAMLARELPDGSLQLIDGHLRTDLLQDETVPVLILDVDEREADIILATLDPLAALAQRDDEAIKALAEGLEVESDLVRELLDNVAGLKDVDFRDEPEPPFNPFYQVSVECEDEAQQKELYEQLTSEGWKCTLQMIPQYEANAK